jgi:hypothetical protein
MPIERDDAKVLCANILSVKYDFLREGGEILVAEKPRHDWPTHGAGGGLYILRRSQIHITSRYDKRLNN